jgi:hypothetical protein
LSSPELANPIRPDGMKNLIPLRMPHDVWWKSIQDQFIRLDSSDSFAERWSGVVEELPQVAGHLLHEDLTGVYEKSYYMHKNDQLVAAIDLASLQLQFLHVVKINAMGLRHVTDYHADNVHFWLGQLTDKLSMSAYCFELSYIDPETGRETEPTPLAEDDDPEPLIEHMWIN